MKAIALHKDSVRLTRCDMLLKQVLNPKVGIVASHILLSLTLF